MPQIPTITATESPLAGAPASAATGEDFGAQIGQALQGLGNTIQQVGAQFGQIGAQQEAEQRQMDVATAVANNTYAPEYNSTITNFGEPSGKGLTTAISDGYDKYMNNALAQYVKDHPGDTKGANAYKIQLLQDKRLYVGKASVEEATMGNNYANVQSETGLATIINDVRANGATTETDYNVQLSKGIQLLTTRPGFNALEKQAGITKLTSDLAVARFAALADAQTTYTGILKIEEELKRPEWVKRFGKGEYERAQRYIEVAKNSIKTESRGLIDATLESLSDRAGNVPLPENEIIAAQETIEGTAYPLTPTQQNKWASIVNKNDEKRRLLGLPVSGVHSGSKTGMAGTADGPARVTYANQNATRNQPIMPQLNNIYTQAANAAGIDEVRVISGGQPATGPNRTGSHRHDHGGAGDIQLIVGGRALDTRNPDDLAKIERFVATAWKLGATGIGAGEDYMGSRTLHVGFGTTAVWGKDGSRQFAPAWLRRATGGTPGMASGNITGGGGIYLLPSAQQGVVQTIGNTYGVDANILAGMWRQESGGSLNPASSPKGAMGPFQFLAGTWAIYGQGGDVHNFEQAAGGAARYMKYLLGMFKGDYKLALMAYNWGEGNVQRWVREGGHVPDETVDYVNKVMGYAGGTNTGSGSPYNMDGGVTAAEYERQLVRERFISDQQSGLNAGVMDYLQTPDGGSQIVKSLSLNSTPADIAAYESQFEQAKQAYELSPNQMKPLTAETVAAFGDLMASNDPVKQAQVLGVLGQLSRQNQEAAYKQLEVTDKTFAQAGRIFADNRRDVALGILQGRKLTKTEDGLDMPWQKEANEFYLEHVGNALAGVDANVRAGTKGAVDALYAYNTRMKPNGELDEQAYEDAIERVTGMNLDEINGVPTLIPPNLTGEVVQSAFSHMDIDQWVSISENGRPPIDKFGRPFEPWAMEGAVPLLISDDGTYQVFVDGGLVYDAIDPSTGVGRPFFIHLIEGEIKEIAKQGMVEAERQAQELVGEGDVKTDTAQALVTQRQANDVQRDYPNLMQFNLPGLSSAPYPPLVRSIPRTTTNTAPAQQPSGVNTPEAQAVYDTVIGVYRDSLEASGLDKATIDQMVEDFKRGRNIP